MKMLRFLDRLVQWFMQRLMERRWVQLTQSLIMVFSDYPSEAVDAVFLHPLSHKDDDEMFPLAASLIKSGRAGYIVTNGSDGQAMGDPSPGKAWAGRDVYLRRLVEAGVPEEKILFSLPCMHTRENNDFFLEVARRHGWKRIITLNQPQQLLRATLGQIRSMQLSGYWMRVYATCPRPWDFQREVFGSQGAQQVRRLELLKPELGRVITYQATGDLATFDEFFAYMARRSSIV
jgi:hypothetical protein